jgi:hypothetical protein
VISFDDNWREKQQVSFNAPQQLMRLRDFVLQTGNLGTHINFAVYFLLCDYFSATICGSDKAQNFHINCMKHRFE